jgi:hypothetical protein
MDTIEIESSASTAPGGSPSMLQLIPLRYAAEILGLLPATLRKVLSRHAQAFPPLYRVDQGCKRRVRYLTDQEVEEIRQRHTKG